MKELDKVKPSNPNEYEFIDRTREFLKAIASDKDDFRYLDYYSKLVSSYDDKEFACKILRIVYKVIDFKTVESVVESFEMYKEQEICKEVKEAYEMSINFLKALKKSPEKFNSYVSAYANRIEPLSKRAIDGTLGTQFDRMHVSNLLIQVSYVIDMYSPI